MVYRRTLSQVCVRDCVSVCNSRLLPLPFHWLGSCILALGTFSPPPLTPRYREREREKVVVTHQERQGRYRHIFTSVKSEMIAVSPFTVRTHASWHFTDSPPSTSTSPHTHTHTRYTHAEEDREKSGDTPPKPEVGAEALAQVGQYVSICKVERRVIVVSLL